MRGIVSEVNREYLDVRECKRMRGGKSKKIEKALFLSLLQYMLRVYLDLCPYPDWALIQTWALVGNIFPKLGAYLSPEHFLGNLR